MRTYDMRIGVDFDEVVYPWYERAHDVSTLAGITGDCTRPLTWYPYQEYGCSKEEWWAALAEGTESGYLYSASPMEGAIDALHLLREHGAALFIVTARGTASLPLGAQIRRLTRDYIDRWEIPTDGVFFTQDKEEVARSLKLTHAIDDRVQNALDFLSAGAISYLHDQPWNLGMTWPGIRRVPNLTTFAERVLQKVSV
jgi:hypothetical protein